MVRTKNGKVLCRGRGYRLGTTRMKLFDERVLGGATFVTVAVGSGLVRWKRTESYV